MSRFAGRWIDGALGTSGAFGVSGFSIDTRTIARGEAFVAIGGERFDGHGFVDEAVECGAAMVVAEREVSASVPVVRVASTRRALIDLAVAHRARLGGTVVGVTGSNGKTTTVRLIDAVLRAGGLVGTASIKSFNNDIGVPLTLLRARERDDYLVSEMGTSGPGEIARLADIGRPEIAVITSIGRAHLEKLGSVRGIAVEKSQIARHARLAVVHGDSPFVLDELAQGVECDSYGEGERCGVRVEVVESHADGVRFTVDGEPFETTFAGSHNAMNAAAAVIVARRLGVGDDQIRVGLLGASPPEMRWERSSIGDGASSIEIINDAYNANPDSVIAGLEALGGADRRRVLVLGEMLELGEQRDQLHAEVGRAIAARAAVGDGPELLVVVGDGARAVEADGVETRRLVSDWDPGEVARLIRPGDRVLLKGSRGIGLEKLLPVLRDSHAGAAESR